MNKRYRTGIGVDVHPIDTAKKCFLGGIEFPDVPGNVGHSDGDVIIHALCDALLSASNLGDLGSVFGVDKEEMKDAPGRSMLAQVMELVLAEGYKVSNATVQLIGNTPKISEYRNRIQEVLSVILNAQVSVSATTTDGLGFLGKGEGRAAIASVLLKSKKIKLL